MLGAMLVSESSREKSLLSRPRSMVEILSDAAASGDKMGEGHSDSGGKNPGDLDEEMDWNEADSSD